MPSTPTTKSQVQAYRFVLRRMQSALVRKDAVMLHDPMRTHSRATIVGICIAAVGLIGFLIWGVLSPKPKPPTDNGIVIGKPSGQVYVMLAKPDRKLIPVFNLASARLLLMAQSQQGAEDNKKVGNASGPGSGGPSKVEAPRVVDDNELRDIPKGRKVGIADGPDLLPSADQRIDPYWTVCDQHQLNPDPKTKSAQKNTETTVLAGVKDLGDELKQNESLLVRLDVKEQGDDKAANDREDVEWDNSPAYLVYRKPTTANLPGASAVRARVDLKASEVTTALALTGLEPREVSVGMLNAIPEAPKLASPGIPGRGDPSNIDLGDSDLRNVGSVFKVDVASTSGTRSEYYVVLKDGIKKIKETTANLIRFYENSGAPEIKLLTPDAMANIPQLPETFDDSTFPEVATEVLEAKNFAVSCLGWSLAGEGKNAEERTKVYIGKDVPGIKFNADTTPQSVPISTPSADGIRIDYFFMPQGRAAVVRQATSKQDFTTGQITLISDRGVKYGVPDLQTANGLGLDNQRPAPRDIIKLLPDGATLSVKDVEQSYDSTPVGPGQYPTESSQAPEGGG